MIDELHPHTQILLVLRWCFRLFRTLHKTTPIRIAGGLRAVVFHFAMIHRSPNA